LCLPIVFQSGDSVAVVSNLQVYSAHMTVKIIIHFQDYSTHIYSTFLPS